MMDREGDGLRARLLSMGEEGYRAFQCRLMPTVEPERVIGIRTPALRSFAREFSKTPEAAVFLKTLPHWYYEENNLHAFLIAGMGDYAQAVAALEEFLPYVDNWATCDMMRPKAFKKRLPELLEQIKIWISSDHTYTTRFGIEMLMTFYLDDKFQPEYLELAAGVRSEEYYVNMMTAWFFATALAKQYDAALPYLQQRRLDSWVHNKAIQKAVESYRITEDQKAYLRLLKLPNRR